MPLYEYKCVVDETLFEAFSSIEQRDVMVCPQHGVPAKRLLSRTHTPKGATERAAEALQNEGFDIKHPPSLNDLRQEITKTQAALSDAMGTIEQAISPA